MSKKALQISVSEMATVAATGVARALDARKAAGIELTAEELSQVNGGALEYMGLINGGRLASMAGKLNPASLGPAQLGAMASIG